MFVMFSLEFNDPDSCFDIKIDSTAFQYTYMYSHTIIDFSYKFYFLTFIFIFSLIKLKNLHFEKTKSNITISLILLWSYSDGNCFHRKTPLKWKDKKILIPYFLYFLKHMKIDIMVGFLKRIFLVIKPEFF